MFEFLVDQRLVKKLPQISVRSHSTYCPSGLKVEVTDQDPLNSLRANIACISLSSPPALYSHLCLGSACSYVSVPKMLPWNETSHVYMGTYEAPLHPH